MPIITEIKPQKNGKRLNIYLDGKFAFGIDLENFVKFGLKVEQELTQEKVEEIVKKSEWQKHYDRLLRYATLRPRSQKEINNWFIRKKVHESMQEELFNRLKQLKLLDDRQFAVWWVDQRLQFKNKSKRDLQYELMQKGIDKSLIGEVLEESPLDEEKTAEELLRKKLYKWEKLETTEKKQKMMQYLSGKGFEWSVLERVVSKVLSKDEV